MSKKPRGLGAGFASLLGSANNAMTEVSAQDELTQLSVSALTSGRFQPRTQWDEGTLAELADSIRSQGSFNRLLCVPLAWGNMKLLPASVAGVRLN